MPAGVPAATGGVPLDPNVPAVSAGKHGGGLLGAIGKYSGADLVGNLGKDVGGAAVGLGPGLVKLATPAVHEFKGLGELATGNTKAAEKDFKTAHNVGKQLGQSTVSQYKDYYGHDIGHHLYQHPLQPLLDALMVADLGATGAAKLGAFDEGRAVLETRSPRAIATGNGPVHTDLSATKPLVKGREVIANQIRQANPEGVGVGPVKVGGELKAFGKQIQQNATQHALSHLSDYKPYLDATKGLNEKEWAALHIRAMDIHPDDLAHLWHGTPAEKFATDPQVRQLVLNPDKKIAQAEVQARRLSLAGEKLLRDRKLLNEDTAAARPSLTKTQASESLDRPVKEIHGQPYYLPHTIDGEIKAPNPLNATGGGKGIPRKLGSTKQNLGVLALSGKLHLRGDVLGPEFLRRVKYAKYDEIHNALIRGAVRVTKQELEQHYGGKLPKGWEYVREKASTRIPPTMRAESETHTPIGKLIPNPEDLHDSQLAEGFSTSDAKLAHQSGGRYYIVPTRTVKAATGEFTRSSNFTHAFISKPLQVWRAAVLGLRPGFITNNLVGNSVMYGVKTAGRGALRDLFGAIREQHGDEVAKKALDSAATPPDVRRSFYEEFFPEQMHGTFGRTQSPSTSAIHAAGSKVAEGYRTATGVIPNINNAVAETPFRTAMIRNVIRNSPEFRRVYSQLPRQTRTFEAAARKVMAEHGLAYQRLVSRQVNNALGDYLHLSPFERNVMRNTVPFYAWYRAITQATFHLAADTPLRANILGQLGQIGKQWGDKELGQLPSFLEGSIPLGHGADSTTKVLATQSLNPYATIEQLRRGSTQDFTQLGLNPFLQGAADAYAKASEKHGSLSPTQLLGTMLKSMVTGLPAARVIAPQPPSRLYPTRNRNTEILSYFGVPVKQYNPGVAAQQARQGR